MNTAKARRAAISEAARAWLATRAADPLNDESDIALESVLLATSVIDPDDEVDEVWSDSPETLMLVVNGSTIIEIDVESGNHHRGEAA